MCNTDPIEYLAGLAAGKEAARKRALDLTAGKTGKLTAYEQGFCDGYAVFAPLPLPARRQPLGV